MGRPLRCGVRMMATGRWSCSTGQHPMSIVSQFGLGNPQRSHRFDHTLSRLSQPMTRRKLSISVDRQGEKES